jgi:NAD(P) transhydrogenase
MNRSLTNVLFGGAAPVADPSEYKMEGQITKTSVDDVVESLENADNVILVCSLYRSSSCNST